MQPRTTATLTSSGSTPWLLTNWHANPMNLGVAVTVATSVTISSQCQIDVTFGDPTAVYPTTLTVFQSSQIAGSSAVAASSANFCGIISAPIAALRLTSNSSTVVASLTVLQSGIG